MKGVAIVLIALSAGIGLCVFSPRCSGRLESDSHIVRMKAERNEDEKTMRQQEAEKLAQVARDLRVLARRYKEKGENKKAQRAIGAAQELDRKIARLLERDAGAPTTGRK